MAKAVWLTRFSDLTTTAAGILGAASIFTGSQSGSTGSVDNGLIRSWANLRQRMSIAVVAGVLGHLLGRTGWRFHLSWSTRNSGV